MKKVKKVFKIIIIIFAGFLCATLVIGVIGRSVTGKWNPVEWGKTAGNTQSKDDVDDNNGLDEGGKDGQDGKDGETPYIGENGNWFIGEVDTGVKAAGQDGADGQDGLTPYIGADGNWYIGETNTGVAATVYVAPVNKNLISDEFKCYPLSTALQAKYAEGQSVFRENEINGLSGAIEIMNGATYQCCSAAGTYGHSDCSSVVCYRGTLTSALKMETATLIRFETGVPMTLYLWLDDIEFSLRNNEGKGAIRIDGKSVNATKVSDDTYGYEVSVELSAGSHIIQKGLYCVLPYMSLTPVD